MALSVFKALIDRAGMRSIRILRRAVGSDLPKSSSQRAGPRGDLDPAAIGGLHPSRTGRRFGHLEFSCQRDNSYQSFPFGERINSSACSEITPQPFRPFGVYHRDLPRCHRDLPRCHRDLPRCHCDPLPLSSRPEGEISACPDIRSRSQRKGMTPRCARQGSLSLAMTGFLAFSFAPPCFVVFPLSPDDNGLAGDESFVVPRRHNKGSRFGCRLHQLPPLPGTDERHGHGSRWYGRPACHPAQGS